MIALRGVRRGRRLVPAAGSRYGRRERLSNLHGENLTMRLVTTDGTRSMWVWLEPETEAEATALRGCIVRSEWTNGRGPEAIARLRALAERLGHPVREARRPVTPGSPCLVVVPRGRHDLFERLTLIARADVTIVWDRRLGERRRSDQSAAIDRRREERRKTPTPWDATAFLVLPVGGASQ